MFDRNSPTAVNRGTRINTTITINLLDNENTLKHRVDMNHFGEDPIVQSPVFEKPSKNFLQVTIVLVIRKDKNLPN